MFSKQLVLALLLLHLGLALSFNWDIVVAQKKQLEFYYNGNLKHTEYIPSATGIITSVTYDPVYNRVLFTEFNKPNMSVSSIDLSTMDIQPLFVRKTEGISKVVYDPVTQLFFWKENKKIYSRSLKPEACNEAVDGNVLVTLNNSIGDIAVDSCGGYIYWITDYGIGSARFNGSEILDLIDKKVFDRRSVAFDQQRQEMYWIDKENENDLRLAIVRDDFKNNKITYEYIVEEETFANSLTVTKDFIYWIGGTQETIWQLSKNRELNETAKPFLKSHRTCSFCQLIAAKYTVQEQTQEIENCKTLDSLIQRYNLCLHGTEVNGESRCECEQGYTGQRCDVSLCHNYCLQGDCTVSAEGQPKCRCKAGHSGERCEVSVCKQYCLNGGECFVNEANEPVCQCTADYEGDRCDVPAYLDKWILTVTMLKDILYAVLDCPFIAEGYNIITLRPIGAEQTKLRGSTSLYNMCKDLSYNDHQDDQQCNDL